MIFSVGLTILLFQSIPAIYGLDCWVCHLNLNGNPNACYDNHQGVLEKCNFTKPLCVMTKKKIGIWAPTVTNWRYCTERKEHHVFNCRDVPGGTWARSTVS